MKKNTLIYIILILSFFQFFSCNKKAEKLEQTVTTNGNSILDEYRRLERILTNQKGYYYSDKYGGILKHVVFSPREISKLNLELSFSTNSISKSFFEINLKETDPFQLVKKYQINIENDKVLSFVINGEIYTRIDVEEENLLDYFREKSDKTITSFLGMYIDSKTSRKYSLAKKDDNYILCVEYPNEMNIENIQEKMELETIGKISGETFSIYFTEKEIIIIDPVINQDDLYDHNHDSDCGCGGDITNYEVSFTLDDKNPIHPESSKDYSNEVNLVLPYLGTYLPEVYISNLQEYKSHRKASKEFRSFDKDNPNAIFLNEKKIQSIYNFHEGSSSEILNLNKDSITVITSNGQETYKIEDNQFLIIEKTKYKKISDINKIDNEVISNFIIDLLIPHNELINENTSLKVVDNKIFYNEKTYEYGIELVGTSPLYDFIVNKDSYESKYIEILDHKINIYSAYSPDNNYDMGWLNDAIYEIENSFAY